MAETADGAATPTGQRQSFLEHLEELRTRLVRSAIAVLAGFLLCYWQIERIFGWAILPLKTVMPDSPLVMIKLTEAFLTYLKLAIYSGLLVASPVVIYQVWAFVAPGLYRHEKRLVAPLVMVSTVLFLLGASFTYFVVLPVGLRYLIEFAGEEVQAMISMASYVSFVSLFMVLFGVMFQIPLAMLMLSRLGVVRASTLARNRKYVLLGSFTIGALLTPPDIFSQSMMSVPIFLLFEISIWIMRLQERARRRREAAAEPPAG